MGRPIIDLTGNKYGYLSVIELDKIKSTNIKYWICKCECGNITSVQGGHLKSGSVISCGCHRYDNLRDNHLKNIREIDVNASYGEWKIIDVDKSLSEKKKLIYYICKCSCGAIRSVKKDSLLSGRSTSCGCIKSKGEKRVSRILKNLRIDFEQQKVFSDCSDKSPLRFDFYIPLVNMCIEYNGSQHYSTGFGWNNSEKLLKTKHHDDIKRKYCKSNNIPMLIIPYTLYPYLDKNILFLLIFTRLVYHHKTKIMLLSRLISKIKVD